VTYGKLAFVDGVWTISEIPPHVAIKLKSLFPKIPKTQVGVFEFKDTGEICADLDWFMNRYPLEMSADDARRLLGGRKQFDAKRVEVERILQPDWKPPARVGFRPGFELQQGQAQNVEVLHRLGRLLIMDDVGLGKSFSAMGAIIGSPYLPSALVVPPHLTEQWVEEYIKRATYLKPHVIRGSKPYDLPDANIFIFTYTNMQGWVDIAATGVFRSVFFDEIHSLRRGQETVKGKAAKVFADNAVLKCGLSATPIFNYGAEIFNIVDILAPAVLGEWTEFVREWCSMGPGGKWIVKDPNAFGSYLRDMQLAVRRVREGRPINTMIVDVDYDEDVAADSEELARTLAQKVVSGSFVERGQASRELDALARHTTGVAKAKSVAAYVRILVKSGTPIILALWHRDVYQLLMDDLADLKPVMYTGSETKRQKDKAKHAFISGEADILLLSLRSGEGIDGLQQRCNTVCFGELDWSPKVHEQIIGRVDRPGQPKSSIDAIYFVTDSGSDPVIIDVHGLKGSQSRGIVDPLSGAQPVFTDETHIKQLAQAYLARASTDA
jgi:hypothetical protein